MSVLEEGTVDDEQEEAEGSPRPKSVTALSILEAFKTKPSEAPDEGGDGLDAESVESVGDSGERLAAQDDVFELEGLDVVSVMMVCRSKEDVCSRDRVRFVILRLIMGFIIVVC